MKLNMKKLKKLEREIAQLKKHIEERDSFYERISERWKNGLIGRNYLNDTNNLRSILNDLQSSFDNLKKLNKTIQQ